MEKIDFFKLKSKNENTRKATNTWYNRYKDWAITTGHSENLETLEGTTLNKTLERN